jgi:hypothetical protein
MSITKPVYDLLRQIFSFLQGCVVVRASSLDSYSDDDFSLLPPLQLKSSIGQLLQKLLQTKPHLFSAAIDEQLLKLNGDK